MVMDNLISQMLYDNTVVRKDFKYATSRLQTCTCASMCNVDSYTRTRCWNTGCRVNGEAYLLRPVRPVSLLKGMCTRLSSRAVDLQYSTF